MGYFFFRVYLRIPSLCEPPIEVGFFMCIDSLDKDWWVFSGDRRRKCFNRVGGTQST